MLQSVNFKKFFDYLWQRQAWIALFSCSMGLAAYAFLLLYSYEGGRYLDFFLNPAQRSTEQAIRLTQAGYWVNPTAAATPNQNQDDDFSINSRERDLLVNWISKRYPVEVEDTELFVSAAYLAAHEIGLDPHLILAVMAIESRFDPDAESPVGAQGLMQVMTRVHSKRFKELGGVEAAKDPVTNIRVGSAILKEYVSRRGSVERGLKSYVGAAAHETDSGYGAKVLAEYRRMKQVSLGKKVPTTTIVSRSPKKLAQAGEDKERVKVTVPAEKASDAANA